MDLTTVVAFSLRALMFPIADLGIRGGGMLSCLEFWVVGSVFFSETPGGWLPLALD